MALLADFFQTGTLILCLIGLALLSQRFWPQLPFALHFCFAPLALVLVLFCLEHYLPLGQLPWLWLPFGILSLWLMRESGRQLWREPVLWYFLLGFGVVFFWRFTFPDIYVMSEMLADLDHLVSYSAGTQLPAEDFWMKGNKDNTYYILQYYAAGLIHRFLGTAPGETYHLGYCTLVALGIAGFGAGIQTAVKSVTAGALASLSMILGGNGATLITPFMDPHHNPGPLAAMRFIGSYAVYRDMGPDRYGVGLLNIIGESGQDAPMEFFSYISMLGDFHPCLSSITMLGLAVLAIGVAHREPAGSPTDRVCVTGAIATGVISFITNTWMVPLQCGLVGLWIIYRWAIGPRDTWLHLIASAAIVFTLIFPFFREFAYESRGYPTHIEWAANRAPFLNWAVIMFPALCMLSLTLFILRVSNLARFACITSVIAMTGTYFFFVHDIYGGDAAIFNTSLKWWPWVYGLVLSLGFMATWNHARLRPFSIAALALTLVGSVYIYVFFWITAPKPHMGRLDGYAWFTDDKISDALYHQLLGYPQGVVLVSDALNGGEPDVGLATFTNHYSLGGWTWHEMLWRGNREDIARISENRVKLYNGTLENPTSWLRAVVPGGVTYIVWQNRDNDRSLTVWPILNDQLKEDFDWHPTFEYDKGRWGIWVRKK
jgi:hypothetical protein